MRESPYEGFHDVRGAGERKRPAVYSHAPNTENVMAQTRKTTTAAVEDGLCGNLTAAPITIAVQ